MTQLQERQLTTFAPGVGFIFFRQFLLLQMGYVFTDRFKISGQQIQVLTSSEGIDVSTTC